MHDTHGTKHLGHLPNIELHHLFPSEFASIRGLYNVSKAYHRDAGQCWLQCFSQLCQVGWMSFRWWDNSWFTWETWAWNPTSHSVLDTNRCALHLLPYLVQRHVYLLSCPFTLWMANIHNPCLNCLKAEKSFFNPSPPLHLSWLKWIKQVTSIRDHIFHLDSPGQSMSWKEQVFLMYCTLCRFILFFYILFNLTFI